MDEEVEVNEYTASNGITVRVDGHPFALLNRRGVGTHYFSEGEAAALREFFQNERDEELGRWRAQEYPDYVVYPTVRAGVSGKGRGVQVLDEWTGRLYDKWESTAAAAVDESEPNLVARAYFAAHPEPKPWDDAKPGQVWVVHVTGDPNPFAARKDYEGLWRSVHNDSHIPKQFIEHARRIWPEVS